MTVERMTCEQDFERFLVASAERPVLLLKHSST